MKEYKNALEVINIRKRYKDFLLDDISFNLPKGFIMGLIGPNGAGKTTTIKAIMNLIKLDKGQVKIFGENLIDNEVKIKNKIGFVYDDCYAYEDFSINENKKLIAPFYSKWDEDKFKFYIDRFKLNGKKKIKELSKGQKVRFSLAIALSHNAELLILDEPTSGLDPVFRSELLDVLFDLIRDEEVSILYSTHITSDLEKLADYITFINNGKVEFSIEKDSLLEEYFIVKGPIEVLDDNIRKYLIGTRKSKYNFEGLTKNSEELNRNFDNLIFERATLDDIIVYYSKKEKI